MSGPENTAAPGDADPAPAADEADGDAPRREEAIVVAIGWDVAHDSDGLVLVTLRYPNGTTGDLPLEGDALARVARGLGVRSVEALVGVPFSKLAPALPVNAGPSAPGPERGERA